MNFRFVLFLSLLFSFPLFSIDAPFFPVGATSESVKITKSKQIANQLDQIRSKHRRNLPKLAKELVEVANFFDNAGGIENKLYAQKAYEKAIDVYVRLNKQNPDGGYAVNVTNLSSEANTLATSLDAAYQARLKKIIQILHIGFSASYSSDLDCSNISQLGDKKLAKIVKNYSEDDLFGFIHEIYLIKYAYSQIYKSLWNINLSIYGLKPGNKEEIQSQYDSWIGSIENNNCIIFLQKLYDLVLESKLPKAYKKSATGGFFAKKLKDSSILYERELESFDPLQKADRLRWLVTYHQNLANKGTKTIDNLLQGLKAAKEAIAIYSNYDTENGTEVYSGVINDIRTKKAAMANEVNNLIRSGAKNTASMFLGLI